MGRPGALRLALLAAACLGLCGPHGALGASFYGESYVELNIIEVSSELSLQLKFQTSKSHGLLFLAAGKLDYCIIELLSGILQVKVNLGPGEPLLLSDQSLRMDDLVWHLVELSYVKNKIVLVIDKHHEATAQVPGGMNNFTFHHGVYVGGHGGLDVPYLDKRIPSFRGCMEDVVFNQREILASLRSYPGFKKVYEVSLGCNDEFFAGENEAISFFSSRSYVTFPEWEVQGEGTLRFAVQTGSRQALLLFQSGREGDFVALGVHEGLLSAYIGRGETRTQLSSLGSVSDGEWHVIQLRVTGRYLDLMVDEQGVRTPLPAHSKLFVSEGPLFVGGLDRGTWEQVKRLDLASLAGKPARGVSLKGCLAGLQANSGNKALRDALVSRDISAGCKTESISHANPSLTVGHLLRSALSPSTPAPPSGNSSSFQGESSSFLVLSDLEVQEGGRALLEQRHMEFNVPLTDLGVGYSQILFKIEEAPAHGSLQVGSSPEQEAEKVFTMLDVRQGKVWYVHDGSEEPTDRFTFSLFSDSEEMPSLLRGRVPWVFNIIVIPVNDAPYLKLPEGNLLLLFENSKKRLTPDLIQVLDPDTDSPSLRISILSDFHSNAGFLENANDPGRPIGGFPQEDLRDGHIFYVHRGHRNSRMVLRASDGELVSNTVVLRVMAVPRDFEVVNRTGVVVPLGGAVLITRSNLSVEVNGEQHGTDAHYDITRPPQFGQIQHRGSNGEWQQVHTFPQHSVDQRRVRYYSTLRETRRESVADHFQFSVRVAGAVSSELLFPVTVQPLTFTLQKNVPLQISDGNKKVLNSGQLRAATEGVETAEGELYFKLLTLPKKGRLHLGDRVLRKGSVFSQKNVTDSVIMYEPHKRPRQDSLDSFRFVIVVRHIESEDYTFRVSLRAAETHVILTNTGVRVKEGEGKLITRSELFVETLDNQTFQYKVTDRPQHGKLTFVSSLGSLESHPGITTFTNQDIAGGLLMYIHDDSETLSDEFSVVATATGPGQDGVAPGLDWESLSTEIKVTISVGLQNDERPVRVVDKIFHVVRGGQRLLTLEDLRHHDPDVDFDDGQLLYTRRGIPNGDLVKTGDPTQKLYQFRQEDMRQGHVLFRHQGADSARFLLLVTDGVHHVSSLLEVSVSEPYVHIVNNTGLLVHRGEDSPLTTANLSVTTNQDVRTDRDVEFHVVRPPKHGQVLVNNSASPSFSQHDLKQGHVSYRHLGNDSSDAFNLTVKVKDVYLDVAVWVHVSLESLRHHVETLHSKTLVVEEGKPVRLDRRRLQAGNEDSLPPGAVFVVRTPPVHGHLRKSTPGKGSLGAEEKPLVSFTLQDVDTGSVLYVPTAPGQPGDRFSLHVTKDSQVVSRVEVLLDIVPQWIPLEVKNVTVQEGGSVALLEDDLRIPSRHFDRLDCEFVLLESPKHGHVESSDFPGAKLMKFARKQVESKLIRYVHGDSEELLDSLTIAANCSELGKQSLPRTLFVTVESVNAEAPVITANRILQVWAGSATELSRLDLCAEDGDSPPQDLVYWVTPPSNGRLALKAFPGRSIQNFTQAQINDGQLMFVHSGALAGGFNFQVTDGWNSTPRQVFSVIARALAISLEVNRGLSIFPGATKPLSSHDLLAVTNDDDNPGNRTVTFTVVSSPRLGRLLKINPDNRTEDVSVFTQDLVNGGWILYQHVDLENTGWTAEDCFTFTASSPPAVLGPEEFCVTISYEIIEPGRQSRLLANAGAAVQEGDKVLIDQSKLDASNLLYQLTEPQRPSYEIWFQVTSLPRHGTILVGERNVTTGKPNFSQHVVNKFGITYLHDDSESLADHFTFVVWPNPKSKSPSKPETGFLEEMFNITITPVNDQAPELKTKGLRLKVLQGGRSVVGPEILKVEDLDSPPSEITYTIIRQPENGFLAMAHEPHLPAQHFTQADVDNCRVWFLQDGSPSSGAFYFSATDGKHRPLYKLFRLDVVPVSITLVNLTDLLIPQGDTTVPVTNAHLSAVTSGNSSQIAYRITRPLQHGHLLMEDRAVTSFGQEDVDSGRLSYHMTDLTASEDRLQLSLSTSHANLTGQTLRVRVQPLLQVTSDLQLSHGEAHQLRRKDLDATALANMTQSDPTFEVTKPPAHGRLGRRAVDGCGVEEVTVFTQRDVDRGLLVLEPHAANLTGADPVSDSFSFLLRADRVQPAMGSLSFTIVPPDPLLLPALTPGVPLSATGQNPVSSVFSCEEPVAVSGHTARVETTRTTWLGENPWGPQRGKGLRGDGKVSPTSVVWPQAATRVGPGGPFELSESSGYPLVVLIPLTAGSLLLVVAAVALCVWLLGRKEDKPRPLIKPQTSLEPTSPSCRPERSVAIPTVTLTPLLRSPSSSSPCVFRAPQCEHTVRRGAEALEQCAPWEAWANLLDPDVAKLCRQTNPALKPRQYWV